MHLFKCMHLQQSVSVCCIVLLSLTHPFIRSSVHRIHVSFCRCAFLTVQCLVYQQVFSPNACARTTWFTMQLVMKYDIDRSGST